MPKRRARRPSRIQLLLAFLAIAIAIAIGGGLLQVVGRGDLGRAERDSLGLTRTGSQRLPAAPRLEPRRGPPTGYRITYRVELRGARPYLEMLAVRRPFDSAAEERGRVGTPRQELGFARMAMRSESGQMTVLVPAPVAGDARPDAVLDDALAVGTVEPREQRMVAGRRCQVYRSGSTTDAMKIERATKDSYVDACIDERGLVLEEVETVAGRPFRRKVATAVDDRAVVAPESMATLPRAATVPARLGGGSVRRVRADSEPQEEFFVGEVVPEGFVHLGRFSVVPPQAALAGEDRRSDVITSTDDVYVRGPDLLVVSRGGTLDFSPPFVAFEDSGTVDLGPVLGQAESILGFRGNEVRVTRPRGNFVRVYGTLPVVALTDVARSLRPTPGGTGVVFENDPQG